MVTIGGWFGGGLMFCVHFLSMRHPIFSSFQGGQKQVGQKRTKIFIEQSEKNIIIIVHR